MRFLGFSLLTALVINFAACKNEINLLDNYHDAIVCYGILDPADTVHYVRVSKVFLGEGSALVMAQNPDSIGFPIGQIQATIEEWKNGIQYQNYFLSPDTTIPREPGIFQNPYLVIYRGRFPVLRDGSTYKLKVQDLIKGTFIYSETPIVQDIEMTSPANINTPLNLSDNTIITFKWNSGAFGLRYYFKVRFHYTEQFTNDTTQVSEHYVDWDIANVDAPSAIGNQSMANKIRRDFFIKMAGDKIPTNLFVRRIAGKLDFIFIGAAQDLATYIDVEDANNNSNTSIPSFSNINNGYGIFSSRATTTVLGYSLDADTRYQLRTNPITYDLNFVR